MVAQADDDMTARQVGRLMVSRKEARTPRVSSEQLDYCFGLKSEGTKAGGLKSLNRACWASGEAAAGP